MFVECILYFSSEPTINITFSFTNNYLPHQQFVKNFVKLFVSLTLFLFLSFVLASPAKTIKYNNYGANIHNLHILGQMNREVRMMLYLYFSSK